MATASDPVEAELRAAQVAFPKARDRRTAAVMNALAAGWSKYRVAKTLGVDVRTVRAIQTAAARRAD